MLTPRPSPGRPIAEATAPQLFPRALEYSCPARGTWNIVHSGLLIPESHQIYVCASGCLRGVILTAAERGDSGRFSTLEMLSADLVATDNERLIIEGVSDILARLPRLPRLVLLFLACVHHFLGVNLRYVYRELRRRWPALDFAECFMDPIRQASGAPPETRLRRELIRQWDSGGGRDDRAVNLIGGNQPLDAASELARLIASSGYALRDWAALTHYDDFKRMGRSAVNVYLDPWTRGCCDDALNLSQPWTATEINARLAALAERLGASFTPDTGEAAERELAATRLLIGDAPVDIDVSFTFRPFSLARRLLDSGFSVRRVYADAVCADDADDFAAIRRQRPALELWPVKAVDLNDAPLVGDGKVLALGQKAAFYGHTPRFVNLVEGGGLWGNAGLAKLARLMRDAWNTPKDILATIRRKGLGGRCLL